MKLLFTFEVLKDKVNREEGKGYDSEYNITIDTNDSEDIEVDETYVKDFVRFLFDGNTIKDSPDEAEFHHSYFKRITKEDNGSYTVVVHDPFID